MTTVPLWLAVLALFITGFVCFWLGVVAMATWAAVHYDGDEQRSEPE